MKTNMILTLATIVALSLAAVSCGKDYSKDVEGNYDGTIVMAVSGATQGSFDATVAVKSTADNEVSITLPAMGEGRMGMPELAVSGVSVDKDGSAYTLKKGEFTITVDETPYVGSLEGSVKDGKLGFTCSVKPGEMPMNIDLTFSSK